MAEYSAVRSEWSAPESIIHSVYPLWAKSKSIFLTIGSPAGRPSHQEMAFTLALCRKLLDGDGAVRVHGGGFAGCVQALMPTDFFPEYKRSMEAEFGAGSCIEINIM